MSISSVPESFSESRRKRLKDVISRRPFHKKLVIILQEMTPEKSSEVDDFTILGPENFSKARWWEMGTIKLSSTERFLRKLIILLMQQQNIGNIADLKLPNILRTHEILGWAVRDATLRCMSWDQFRATGSQWRQFFTLFGINGVGIRYVLVFNECDRSSFFGS